MCVSMLDNLESNVVTPRPTRTDLPFHEALPALLAQLDALPADAKTAQVRSSTPRATLNALAARLGIGQSHLWRVVNRPNERRPSLELVSRVARELDLPDDYFVETRQATVREYLAAHPQRLNTLYREALREESARISTELPETNVPTKTRPA